MNGVNVPFVILRELIYYYCQSCGSLLSDMCRAAA